LLATSIRAYEAGVPVTFGDLTIDQSGVTRSAGGKFIGWPEIQSMGLSGHDVQLDPGRLRMGIDLDVSGRPNGAVMPSVLRHIAAQRAIPVR
jgi:hypothetical protein